MKTFTYIYQAEYGSPEVDRTNAEITKAVVGKDNKSVRLTWSKLEEGHIHDLDGRRRALRGRAPLLHNIAYYTMNFIPAKQ